MIYVDASPFGLGAWLSVDAQPVSYFSDVISPLDCEMPLIGDLDDRYIGPKFDFC